MYAICIAGLIVIAWKHYTSVESDRTSCKVLNSEVNMKVLVFTFLALMSVLLTQALMTPTLVRTWGEEYRSKCVIKNMIVQRSGRFFSTGSYSEERTFPCKVILLLNTQLICYYMVWLIKTFALFQNETNYKNITMIRVVDQKNDKDMREALITNGGPGYTYVTMKFTAPSRSDYSFIVDIIGGTCWTTITYRVWTFPRFPHRISAKPISFETV